jgi:tryptophan synthase beta subunit
VAVSGEEEAAKEDVVTIDDQFEGMATDDSYQKETRKIQREFGERPQTNQAYQVLRRLAEELHKSHGPKCADFMHCGHKLCHDAQTVLAERTARGTEPSSI